MIDEKGNVKYEIPVRYKRCIDENFIRQMLFGVFLFLPNGADFDSIKEWLDYSEGTAGYMEAFKHACIVENHIGLYEYYNSLEWYDSDLFDEQLSDMLIAYLERLSAGKRKRLLYEELCRENQILLDRVKNGTPITTRI